VNLQAGRNDQYRLSGETFKRISIMRRRGVFVLLAVLGVLFLVAIAGIFALYLAVGRGPVVPSQATLMLKVGGELSEIAPTDIVSYVGGGARFPTVRGIIETLRKAKVDGRIKSVILKPTGFTTPHWAKIQELRDAVLDFKKSGKPLYAYLEYGGDRD